MQKITLCNFLMRLIRTFFYFTLLAFYYVLLSYPNIKFNHNVQILQQRFHY